MCSGSASQSPGPASQRGQIATDQLDQCALGRVYVQLFRTLSHQRECEGGIAREMIGRRSHDPIEAARGIVGGTVLHERFEAVRRSQETSSPLIGRATTLLESEGSSQQRECVFGEVGIDRCREWWRALWENAVFANDRPGFAPGAEPTAGTVLACRLKEGGELLNRLQASAPLHRTVR